MNAGGLLAKQIALMDLMMLLAETQSSPMHVCGLMLFEKPVGQRELEPVTPAA